MDKSAMFTITYGLFVAGVEEGGKLNVVLSIQQFKQRQIINARYNDEI